MKRQIRTTKEVKELVDKFYQKVNNDALLSPVFNDQAKVNWEEHLPKMYRFWGSILLGTGDYQGRPFPPHALLRIGNEHFDRWIQLFVETVDENFEGTLANEAKHRAYSIASIFKFKLSLH